MTEGKPFPLILRFSIPLVLGNLFQQMYNLVDSVIVGRVLGLNALTAVGATASINFLIIGFTLGVCSGLAIPVAQRFGAHDYKDMRCYVINAAYSAMVLAAILTVLTCLMCGRILTWMKTPAEIFQGSYDYFLVICMGIPFTFLYNTASGIIRAMGDSRTPFCFLVLSTVLNVVLDLVFIICLGWGVAGAAWATILAQGVAGLICLWYMIRRYRILRPVGEEKKLRISHIKVLLSNGLPMGLQFSITAIGSIMLQSAVNLLDVVYVSAYAGAMKIKALMICPFDAVANACATFGGQNLGAGKPDRIKQGVKAGIGIALTYAILAGILLCTCGSSMAALFIRKEETMVLEAVQRFLTVEGLCLWMLSFLNCFRMTIQGIGFSGISVIAGVSELLARGLMSVLVIPVFGFAAVCVTDQAAWVAADVVVITAFCIIMKVLKRRFASPA